MRIYSMVGLHVLRVLMFYYVPVPPTQSTLGLEASLLLFDIMYVSTLHKSPKYFCYSLFTDRIISLFVSGPC